MDNKEIIYDIKQTWEGGATLSALALALTIPDICNPGKQKGEYIKWYDECVIKYLKHDEKWYYVVKRFMHLDVHFCMK